MDGWRRGSGQDSDPGVGNRGDQVNQVLFPGAGGTSEVGEGDIAYWQTLIVLNTNRKRVRESSTLLAPGKRCSFTYGSASPFESIGFKP